MDIVACLLAPWSSGKDPDRYKQAKIPMQLQKYKNNEGLIGRAPARNAAKSMPAWAWWVQFGAGMPELQAFAVEELAQPASASSCERNWSAFEFIHSKKRNRLSSNKASDLVYVYCNLRLLDKIEDLEYEEAFVAWSSEEEEEEE
jgi:hypothetical protein